MKIYLSVLLVCLLGVQSTQAQVESPVKWYSLEEAMALNAKQPKKIIMDVFTDWCGWCKTMDKNTFSDPYIAQYLNENFYPVKFNAEGTNDITYKGKVYKNRGQGQRSAHDLAIALLQGRLSYPTIVFMDSDNNLITYISGYLTPDQIEPILAYIAQDGYKKEKWEDFRAKFVSKIPKK